MPNDQFSISNFQFCPTSVPPYHYWKDSLIFARKFQAAILVKWLMLACRAANTAVIVVLPLEVRT